MASLRTMKQSGHFGVGARLSMRLCHAKELVACPLDRLDVVHVAAIPLRAEPAATWSGEMVV